MGTNSEFAYFIENNILIQTHFEGMSLKSPLNLHQLLTTVPKFPLNLLQLLIKLFKSCYYLSPLFEKK